MKPQPLTYMPTLPDFDQLPAEYALNPYAPSTDRYMQEIDHVKKEITAVAAMMKPKHVEIIKMHHSTGKPYLTIGKELKCSGALVSKVCLSPLGQRLIALLRYLQLTLDGPSEQLRQAMLWRIAVRGETLDARLAISAIAEMNKMQGVYDSKGSSGGVTVIINNQVLAAGPLDG